MAQSVEKMKGRRKQGRTNGATKVGCQAVKSLSYEGGKTVKKKTNGEQLGMPAHSRLPKISFFPQVRLLNNYTYVA